jgi:hypothetical protein
VSASRTESFWRSVGANAKPIDWDALGRSAEAAVHAAIDSAKRTSDGAKKDPAAAQLAGFFVLLAGASAFCERMMKEEAATQAETNRTDAHTSGAESPPSGESPSANSASAAPELAVDPEVREAAALLGVSVDASLKQIRSAHRRKMASGAHPDHGGDPEVATSLNVARDLLTKHATRVSS